MPAAGSEVVIENPSLFKWEIQHLLKSMGFDAGRGLRGVDEKSPTLSSESTPLSPTSGVEWRFMTLQACQISMDDVTELGEKKNQPRSARDSRLAGRGPASIRWDSAGPFLRHFFFRC